MSNQRGSSRLRRQRYPEAFVIQLLHSLNVEVQARPKAVAWNDQLERFLIDGRVFVFMLHKLKQLPAAALQ